FIRFRHKSRYKGGFTWDDIRISSGFDVFGPKVVSTTAVRTGGTSGAVTGIQIVFNEPIDPATFTTYDVTITAPGGNVISLAGNPVDGGDHTTFTAQFSTPEPVSGLYQLNVGPNLTDAQGTRMDQNQNGLPGDGLSTSVVALVVSPHAVPYEESFDGDPASIFSAWEFNADGGMIGVDSGHAREGSYALELAVPSLSGTHYQDSVLHANLAGKSGVVLDCWALEFVDGGSLEVSLSVDGTNWRTLKAISGPPGAWRQHWIDLDAARDAAGWSYTSDVRIRFRLNSGSWVAAGFALDGVRVRAGQVMPAVVAAVPYTEGFEVSELAGLGAWWELPGATLAATQGHSGTRSLAMGYGGSAEFAVDLAPGGTPLAGVTLDFWSLEPSSGGDSATTTVSWSVDGITWRTLQTAQYNTLGGWLHRAVDLDKARIEAGWSYPRSARFRFAYTYQYNGGRTWMIDDIRVAAGGSLNVFGPKVASCPVAGQSVAGPLASFTVTFNEAVEPASFTAADVSLTSPSGAAVSVGSVSDSGDHTTFTVALAPPQGLAGLYRLAIGPNVADTVGNAPMDQDQNGVPGDAYSTTFTIPTTVALPPFAEGFEAGGIESLASCWAFTV
ncbi:MAG: Ig-like domain-containing protein, partial [Verrucomicrobiota bacterium]